MKDDQDPRLDRLARQLRDEGMPPERDLWPEIDAAITRREGAGRRPRRAAWWPAAAAAVLMLALGLGALRTGGGAEKAARTPAPPPVDAPVAAAPAAAMEAVDLALKELEASLAADPDNLSLTRLVLMVHRTRGELLRRNPTTDLGIG